MKNKLANLAFAGIFAFNIFPKANVHLATDSGRTPTGSSKNGIRQEIKAEFKNDIKAAIQKVKDTRVELRNVKVTAVSTAGITVDNSGVSVTVNITDKTQLRRKFWGKSVLTEISVGDNVDVIGKWTDDTKTAIDGYMIRDESIQKRFGVFFGTVKSLTNGGFVVTTIRRDDETVTIGTAKLINRKEEIIASADVKVGDKVRVRGLWNSNVKTITEVKEVKDFSLPVRTPGEPKVKGTPIATPTSIPTPTSTASATPTATP